jgi:threonine/homoserine/homoserine lactone efflux protein
MRFQEVAPPFGAVFHLKGALIPTDMVGAPPARSILRGPVPQELIAFILTAIAIELTPGPNMAYLAILSLDRGRIAGLAAVAGVAVGLTVLGLAAGYGFGLLISETRWLYETVRWGGIVYLLWLAYDTWRDSGRPVTQGGDTERLDVHFRRGLVTNILNPKAALFYVTVLPSFINPTSSISSQSLLLAAIYVMIATGIHVVVVLAAGTLRSFVVSAKLRERLGFVFALILVAIAVWLVISTQRT